MLVGCKDLFHPEGSTENNPDGTVKQYTVTFDADGGTPAAQTKTVNRGASLGSNMPTVPTKSGYAFGSWWTSRNGGGSRFTADTTVNANITVYARWVEPLPSNLSLEESLTWLASHAAEGGDYTITVSADESFGPKSLYGGRAFSLTIKGDAAERSVRLNSSGSLFTVESGVTLTLGNNVTLLGRSDNTKSLVRVNSGGTLIMESGSKITGNTNTVWDYQYSGSSSSSSGGVFVYGGTFTMNGGAISGNTASASSSYSGGGVYVYNGTFTMNGGAISGNTASASSFYSGGGVYVNYGRFTMSGGVISGNTGYSGGGMYVGNGTFTMSGGAISGNTGNSGGGMYIGNGTFTMSGGTISGNTGYSGGGVYVGRTYINGAYVDGTFTKESGGTIYGSDASGALKNTASSDARGHAVYVESGGKKRNSTAGPGVTLNSSLGEAEGGWVDQYTVTFDADGGTPATRTLTVNSGVIRNIRV
jgi:hypothetical protein